LLGEKRPFRGLLFEPRLPREVEGQSRASGTHEMQAAAWEQAKRIAERNDAEALLHGRDGRIRERSTYGSDPRRTKG
jgi:hypothetical protein